MDKKFWNEVALKGYKWSEKLRIYWALLSLILLGSLADEAPIWLLVLLLISFIAAVISSKNIEIKDDDKEEEI